MSDDFSLLHSWFPCSPRDIIFGGAQRELRKWHLGLVLYSCAGSGSWDGGSSWQAGSAAERQLCPGAAPLQSPAGLTALPAGTEGRQEK